MRRRASEGCQCENASSGYPRAAAAAAAPADDDDEEEEAGYLEGERAAAERDVLVALE